MTELDEGGREWNRWDYYGRLDRESHRLLGMSAASFALRYDSGRCGDSIDEAYLTDLLTALRDHMGSGMA